ncbi:hypothetical protein TRM7615_03800 [Falsiruegeria mediterranea M17]|uniref:Uncharacterized protein n=1 Tax=Falsiruegeria mediterranea M17 TaxID=1200281 RepID=A0A2R8CCZ2_9RHOB|nr:hypothetical protein TRM7615_03800 [Falsiruegeria mediterranea M17]
MNLLAASSLLVQDRRDWRRPHLLWLPSSLYRSYLSKKDKK